MDIKTKTYFIKVSVPLSIAIISATNKIHINDNSKSIMFGMQHNFRHFQGEVSLTKSNKYNIIKVLIKCNKINKFSNQVLDEKLYISE